jgi:hypothetical protein
VGHAHTSTQELVLMPLRSSPLLKLLPMLAATAMGCVGNIGSTSSSDPDAPGGPANRPTGTGTATGAPGATVNDASFTCDPNAKPPAATLRRLTSSQYRSTLASLAAWSLSDSAKGTAVMTELTDVLHALPDDQREPVPEDLHGSYRRLDQTLQQEHVDTYYAVGVAMGAALTTSARIGTVVGSCATDGNAANDADCLDKFIQRFGGKLLRRPVTPEESTFYKSVYGTSTAADPAAYADVIGVMLNAPQFLYFVEHGETEVAGQTGVYEISPFELAARLSYQFWETTPDDELLKVAADGTLMQPDVFQQQVERLYADARTQATISQFVADWLKTEDLPALDAHNTDPTFKNFAGTDLPKPELRQQMIDDVLGMLDYYVWKKPGSLDDLFTSNLSFNKGPDLAKIYGTATWDGTSAPPAFGTGQRPGLLTRALFLTSGSANTRPILKGVFIRRRMLCDDIPPPPPGANAVPPQLKPDMTTREVVEELTQKTGTVCAACHKTIINPLGFATEGFDALGRARTMQRLFDANGVEVGQKPINTQSVPLVAEGDDSVSSGPADLETRIVASGKANACLARNYFRFTYARWEDLDVDGCALEDLRLKLANGGKLGDLLKEVAMSPAFRRRAFQ